MTTRLLIGDVFDRMAELEDGSFDLIVTSPPFLELRSYLPADHPLKAKEIGSEPNPAAFLDTMLALTAEWRRLLAPHGSIAIELGDKYSGSGGAGGDYDDEGWRDGQNRFGSVAGRPGWPLPKSLTLLPELYPACLAYGRNLLTGEPSPAGRWRVRNVKPWIRSNPPVGALGDKERPATSYVTVACTGASRWFDLDAVRTPPAPANRRTAKGVDQVVRVGKSADRGGNWASLPEQAESGGAPPLDWWHPVDAVIDQVIDQRAGKANGGGGGSAGSGYRGITEGGERKDRSEVSVGARGVHIRRALTEAGLLPPGDFYDVSPRGYAGAHYAVWPPELVRQLIDEMCPRRVCRECGEPSKRIVGEASYTARGREVPKASWIDGGERLTQGAIGRDNGAQRTAPTLGWSCCGHGDECTLPFLVDVEVEQATYDDDGTQLTDARLEEQLDRGHCDGTHWRPGRVLDPFVGSGTTLAVASGMGRDSVGIDLDPRNADLTAERVGMFLEVDYGTKEATA